METISQFMHTLFRLTHKYAFTLPFAQRLRDFVSNGISFIYLQANYLEWQLQDSLTRQQQFNCHKTLWERLHASNQQSIPDCSSLCWDEYKEKILSFCPSDDLLCDIFLISRWQ